MPAHKTTLRSGTGGQACAACKHQRRRCTPDCLLAPFFPGDQPSVFQSVHRLFGVKHVQNLLKKLLAPDERAVAVRSIKFHAAMRDRYPVDGCLAEIRNLAHQVQIAEEELHLVAQQLAYHRQTQQQNNSMVGGTVDGTDIDSSLFVDGYNLQETRDDYKELHPFFDSLGSPLKDSMEQMAEKHELKSAAACFTLTSVN